MRALTCACCLMCFAVCHCVYVDAQAADVFNVFHHLGIFSRKAEKQFVSVGDVRQVQVSAASHSHTSTGFGFHCEASFVVRATQDHQLKADVFRIQGFTPLSSVDVTLPPFNTPPPNVGSSYPSPPLHQGGYVYVQLRTIDAKPFTLHL